MTTPADNIPFAVINDAYQDAGLLALGVDLSGEQLAVGMRRLRDVMVFLQTKGLKLFYWVDTPVTLVAGQATYTIKPNGDVDMTPRPFRALQGYYLYASGNIRRQLTVLSWNDYLTLGQAGTASTNQGTISQFFVNKKATELDVTFWLCPDATEAANGTAHLLLQSQGLPPSSLNETITFPSEWRMCLRWTLAADLSTGQPDSVIMRCEQKAMYYQDVLENWDVEDAPTSIQPDMRTGVAGGFR